jgi:hypothetical protein
MDSVFPNRINGIVKARLKGLKSLLEESGQVEHASTKGALREKYLTDFLRSLLPPNYVITGGFICDVLGNITPQIDLIISDTTAIPSIALTGEVALVPVEAALVGIEVKSRLTSEHLDQIRNQAEAIRSLRPIAETNAAGSHVILLFVFAFESGVSKTRLASWLKETPELFGVCILDEFFIRKGRGDIITVPSNDWQETLVFISSLLHGIIRVEEERLPQTLNIWRRYVVGVDPQAT